MHIFLDTTVLRADFHLSSPEAKLLEQFIRATGARLFVPIVVVEEAKNQFREELEQSRRELGKELGKLSRMLKSSSQSLPPINVESEVEKYNHDIRDRLSMNYRAVVIDFPSVPHQVIVRRDLGRRKPFSKTGKGYRDSLIWYSILDVVKGVKDEFVFITDNTSDFWDEAQKDLHEELRLDLNNLGGIVGPFRVIRNLQEFNSNIVKPKLAKIEQLREELQNGRFPYLSVQQIAMQHKEEVKEDLNARDALQYVRYEFDVPTSAADFVDFGHITSPDDIAVTEVFEMPDANLFIGFRAEYEVTLVFSVPVEQSEKWEDAGFCLESAEKRGDLLMSIDVQVLGDFSLIYNSATHKIESQEVLAQFH